MTPLWMDVTQNSKDTTIIRPNYEEIQKTDRIGTQHMVWMQFYMRSEFISRKI